MKTQKTDNSQGTEKQAGTKKIQPQVTNKDSKKVVPTPKQESFTRTQAVGIVMRENPKFTKEEIITTADKLYHQKTGKALNPKETTWLYRYAVNFLNGYNS